jgi:pyruvate formate lyase activating enzyme
MKIASLLKQSFIDWDGKIAAVIFTKGCNFRCSFCHNPSLVYPEQLNKTPDIPETEVFGYLESRKNWLDGVVVTGGEPTIHEDLPCFIEKIKQIGYLVKLDTNGSDPVMLHQLIQLGLIDYVAMDIKTILHPVNYEKITCSGDECLINRIELSIRIIRESGIEHQFRTTLVPGIHSPEIIASLKNKIFPDNLKLQQYRPIEIY